ncbi:MAG: rhodanese-like domain-containing protein [Kangiellaceae bacterium]|nr:rhodanese-like domain-containing protein [Kangiellaceae bacterium]
MNELIQFAQGNLLLSAAWVVVAVLLAFTQIRHMASAPKSVSTQTLTNMVNRDDAVVIDVRAKADFGKGHIHGAINIPLSTVKDRVDDLEKYKNTPIIMVCANGISVAAACNTLKKSGMQQVHKLAGGMGSWVGDNLPVVK